VTDRKDSELEQLNAFIDGELDVEARAEVTAKAARDPAYAQKLAMLSQLKAAIADAVPTPEIEVSRAPSPSRHRMVFAVAASLVLLIAAGIGWTNLTDDRTAPIEFALEKAIETHRAWKPQTAGNSDKGLAQPVAAVLHPNVPDLSANGLDLAYVGTRRTTGGRDMLLIGYLGSRGCRLTMFVNRAEGPKLDNVVHIDSDNVVVSLWRAGSLSYALLAEGMAKPRFRLIADSVRRASLRRLPLDHDTRMALSRSRAASPPCRA
jgi:anti-sigma factor RsiW